MLKSSSSPSKGSDFPINRKPFVVERPVENCQNPLLEHGLEIGKNMAGN